MTPLRRRMIEDMNLAGLAPGSQQIYIKSVRRLATYYRRSPDELSEEEVRSYLIRLRDRGAARSMTYCFGVKSASAAWRVLAIRSRSSRWGYVCARPFVLRPGSGYKRHFIRS